MGSNKMSIFSYVVSFKIDTYGLFKSVIVDIPIPPERVSTSDIRRALESIFTIKSNCFSDIYYNVK